LGTWIRSCCREAGCSGSCAKRVGDLEGIEARGDDCDDGVIAGERAEYRRSTGGIKGGCDRTCACRRGPQDEQVPRGVHPKDVTAERFIEQIRGRRRNQRGLPDAIGESAILCAHTTRTELLEIAPDGRRVSGMPSIGERRPHFRLGA
jgi:hypothetical protein